MFFNFIPGYFWMFCFFTWLFNISFSCKPCVMWFLVIYGCSPALAWWVSSLHCTRVMFLILSSTHFDGGDDDVGASSFKVTMFWIRFTMVDYIKVDKMTGSIFSLIRHLVRNSKSVHSFFYYFKISIMKMFLAVPILWVSIGVYYTSFHSLPAFTIVDSFSSRTTDTQRELFFKKLKLLGLGRQIGPKFYEAFWVFLAKL